MLPPLIASLSPKWVKCTVQTPCCLAFKYGRCRIISWTKDIGHFLFLFSFSSTSHSIHQYLWVLFLKFLSLISHGPPQYPLWFKPLPFFPWITHVSVEHQSIFKMRVEKIKKKMWMRSWLPSVEWAPISLRIKSFLHVTCVALSNVASPPTPVSLAYSALTSLTFTLFLSTKQNYQNFLVPGLPMAQSVAYFTHVSAQISPYHRGLFWPLI